MDPVTTVGLAAGAVQLVDVGGRALLATIRLLRDLKEAPKNMSQLLQDVDKSVQRIHALRAAVQQPSSASFSHLSVVQMQQAKNSIENAYQATVDLQGALQSVSQPNGVAAHGRGKRAWKSVVSVSMEWEIERQIARVERLSGVIIHELQVSSLELLVAQKYATQPVI